MNNTKLLCYIGTAGMHFVNCLWLRCISHWVTYFLEKNYFLEPIPVYELILSGNCHSNNQIRLRSSSYPKVK